MWEALNSNAARLVHKFAKIKRIVAYGLVSIYSRYLYHLIQIEMSVFLPNFVCKHVKTRSYQYFIARPPGKPRACDEDAAVRKLCVIRRPVLHAILRGQRNAGFSAPDTREYVSSFHTDTFGHGISIAIAGVIAQ